MWGLGIYRTNVWFYGWFLVGFCFHTMFLWHFIGQGACKKPSHCTVVGDTSSDINIVLLEQWCPWGDGLVYHLYVQYCFYNIVRQRQHTKPYSEWKCGHNMIISLTFWLQLGNNPPIHQAVGKDHSWSRSASLACSTPNVRFKSLVSLRFFLDGGSPRYHRF